MNPAKELPGKDIMHLILQRKSIHILMIVKEIVGMRILGIITQLGQTRVLTQLTIINIKLMDTQRKILGILMNLIDSAEILKRSSAPEEMLENMMATNTNGVLMISMIKNTENMKKSFIVSKKNFSEHKKKLMSGIVNGIHKKTSVLKMHCDELVLVLLAFQFSPSYCLERFQMIINMHPTQLHIRAVQLIHFAEIVFCFNSRETP
jgi:hypothetical protein